MSSKKIYLIIGEGRCGKSSLVRALTGVYRSAIMEIGLSDKKTIFKTRILPQSAQEANLSPNELIDKLDNDWGSSHALVTLRLHKYNGHGPAIDYVNILKEVHSIEKIVLMSTGAVVDRFKLNNVQENIITSSYSRPVNGNASLVRDWWGWL